MKIQRLMVALSAMGIAASLMSGCGSSSESSEANEEARSSGSEAQWAQEGASVPEHLRMAGVTALDLAGPHDPPVDRFHPDQREVRPALGGRVIQHIASEPPNLNMSIENSAVIHWIHRDIHAGLLQFNVATYEKDLDLATGYDREDTIILKGGRADDNSNILFGLVREDGDSYVISSGSRSNPITERRVPKADVESVEKGTVFTFRLRQDAIWHDGETFDAEDVYFSWTIYDNPGVDCDERRYVFEDIPFAEVLDPYTVRFFHVRQYFAALDAFEMGTFCILPSHLYNLKDPTNADYNPNATLDDEAEYINDNPRNNDWIGLGPYKLTVWERGRYLEAEKFEGYWEKDPRKSGYMDVLRWTHVDDDNLAFQALLNQEVDIFDRVKSEDFMGAATQQDVFVENFYKAFTYTGNMGYISWNLYNSKFSDYRVRTALAHAFDIRNWTKTNYEGLALPMTGSMFRFGPAYNAEVEPLEHSVEKAQQLLADAGWYDRDGDDIIDKDGVQFTMEIIMPGGNKASETLLQKAQESFEKVGIKANIRQYEWATFLQKILDRDFEACNLAWVLNDVESDPFALWHSSEAARDKRSSNHAGFIDAVADSLIEMGRRELDDAKRHKIWHQLHARVYELQPYLFGHNVPRKIAFNKKLRGVKLYKFAPGYNLREMYYEEGTPGTRPLESGA